MKFIKKNIKIIIGFIVGVILASGITVYATYKYFATDVSYTKDGSEISVEDALNDLYNKQKNYIYTETDYLNYGTTQYSLGQANSKGVMYNYGTGTSTSTGIFSFDMKINNPSKIVLFYKDIGLSAYQNVFNWFTRNSNDTYDIFHELGSEENSVVNGTIFTYDLGSDWKNIILNG